jgi:exopolysaccharide production protein ExoQ
LVNLLIDTGILGALIWLALLAAILITAMHLSVTLPGLQSRDRCTILALTLALIANSVFTQGLGAPANVAYSSSSSPG